MRFGWNLFHAIWWSGCRERSTGGLENQLFWSRGGRENDVFWMSRESTPAYQNHHRDAPGMILSDPGGRRVIFSDVDFRLKMLRMCRASDVTCHISYVPFAQRRVRMVSILTGWVSILTWPAGMDSILTGSVSIRAMHCENGFYSHGVVLHSHIARGNGFYSHGVGAHSRNAL